jgi:hypothetical protein
MLSRMATDVAPMKSTAPRAVQPSPLSSEPDRVLTMVNRFRPVVLTSPLWLAIITVIVSRLGGPGVRDVVHFLTFSPLR